MADRYPSSNNGNDGMLLIGAGIGGVILLGVITWYQAHTHLSFLAIQSTWFSMPILEACYSFPLKLGVPVEYINYLIPQSVIDDISILKYSLPRTDPSQVSFDEFNKMLEISGYSLRLLSPPLAIISVIYILKKSKAARLNRTMNIFSLSKSAMVQFPQIRPAIIENLLKKDPDHGYFRREASPLRFAILNGLISTYDIDFKNQLLPSIATPTLNKAEAKKENYYYIKDQYSDHISKLHNRCILDLEKTKIVFENQLGEVWTGASDQSPYIKGLYAALISFTAGDKDSCMALLEQFNRSWTPPKKKIIGSRKAFINTKGVNKIIEKYEMDEQVQKIINAHAYTTTIMPSLLEAARKKGRLGTSLFLWLKVVDRGLWYSLNQEGGQCSWSESAGPRAHKLAENAVKGPIHQPLVQMAVSEFESYLSDGEGWIPEPIDLPKAQDNGALL